MATPEAPTGEIYDLGYRHYDGKRLGRSGAIRALYVEGLRGVFGIGRGFLAKIPPMVLVFFMLVPAIVQAAVSGLVGNQVQIYRPETYFTVTVYLFTLFCAFQTPVLVTGDQQSRVLALYFSRAVYRSDYVLARITALATSLFVIGLAPHFVLLAGRWMSAVEVWPAIKESAPLMPRIVFACLLIAILLSCVSLAISSVIRRAPIATCAILGAALFPSLVATGLIQSNPDKMRHVVLASPTILGQGLSGWVFDTVKTGSAEDSVRQMDRLYKPKPRHYPPASDTMAFRTYIDSISKDTVGRASRRRRSRMSVSELASLPGTEYLAGLLGYVLVASAVLTLRYRRIET